MKSTDPTRSLRLTTTSKLLLTCIAVALFVSCASTVPTSKQHAPQLATPVQPLIGEAYELLLTQWRDEHGRIPADGMLRAMEQARALREAMRARPERAGITPANWSWLGPGNIGGRVTSLVFRRDDPAQVFAGTAGGGIWKSVNGGTSWSQVNDFFPNLAITALAVHPTDANRMYAGTGEGFGNGGAIRGAGILRSTDGGASWTQIASTATSDFFYVNAIAISPDGATILAATSSAPGGVFRSTDGGESWAKEVDGGDVGDVEFHPTDSSKAISAGRGAGVVISSDGGQSWAESQGLPASGRVEVAWSRSNPSVIYAGVNDAGGTVFKSTNGGQSFEAVSTGTKYLGGQGWIHNAIWVDPTNENNVVVGGLDIWRSGDGGRNFTKISRWQNWPESAHGDQKTIVSPPDFSSSNPVVYIGNDGGVYRAQNIFTVEELAGWQDLNTNFGATQFYGAAGNPTTQVIVGGTQDNGTIRYSGDAQKWTRMYGGDGGFAAADPSDPQYFYGEYVNLTVHRSSNGGAYKAEDVYGQYYSWNGEAWEKLSTPSPISDAKSPTANFIAPFILDPNNPSRMLAGGRRLWAAADIKNPLTAGGPTWRAIKPAAGAESRNNISAIAVARGNSNISYVGHNNGDVFKTSDGTAETPAWTKLGAGVLPARYVNSFAIDPRDPNIVFVSFGGFVAQNVWKTTDGGQGWTAASGSEGNALPSAPVRSLALSLTTPGWIYAGTEVGIFASEDGGAIWGAQEGPANVAVRELFWMGSSLVAATFGRGVYKAGFPASSARVACHSLTIRAEPSSHGAVLADVEPNCANGAGYLEGTKVRLTARPAWGHALRSWDRDGATDAAVVELTVDRDTSVVARFTEAGEVCYGLSILIVPVGSGSVQTTPPPNCSGSTWIAGTVVGLKGTAGAGYAFGGWSGAVFGPEPIADIELDKSLVVSATFAPPASNDDLGTAFDLGPGLSLQPGKKSAVTVVSMDTSAATNSASDPVTCEGGKGGKTVWFRFSPAVEGTLLLSTQGSNYDTTMAVFTSSGGSLSVLECDDDSEDDGSALDDEDEPPFDLEDDLSTDQLSELELDVEPGVTYIVGIGDATEPQEYQAEQDGSIGSDPLARPEGGLLELEARYSTGEPRKRPVRR